MAYTDACICLCVHNKNCFFSNMPRWIFMILGYNDHQVQVGGGGIRGVQEFGVKGHLGVISGNCFKYAYASRLHNLIDLMKLGRPEVLSGFSGNFE